VNYISRKNVANIYKVSYLVMNGILEHVEAVEAPVKTPRKSRAKPKVSVDGVLVEPVKKPRASRAKAKVVSDPPVEMSGVPVEVVVKKPRASRAKAKVVDPPVESGNVVMPEISQMLPDADPKWIKFRDVLVSGRYDKLRADGGFHPGEMSIHVSRALADYPHWRPLMADLLESRGRKDVARVFGL